MNNKKRFDQITSSIKTIKIQGARNVAKSALLAYSLIPTQASITQLISLRPTEPMLQKVLSLVKKKSYPEILAHFDIAQEKINKEVFRLIKSGDKVSTHCHSTNVVNALIYTKKKGKDFEVFNTETRPLFQGRKTAKELKRAKIKSTMFIDSAFAMILEKEDREDRVYVDKIFLGADALLEKGIINKIGSKVISELAFNHKIPLYIVADSWKYSSKKIPIENRSLNEIWDHAPKKIKMQNPAFEFVPEKYITKIVTELGTMNYKDFIKKVKLIKN